MKALKNIVVLLFAVMTVIIYVDLVRFPEDYITTWRYHLYNDLKAGNEIAIDYYQRNYINKGRVLFDDIGLLSEQGENLKVVRFE